RLQQGTVEEKIFNETKKTEKHTKQETIRRKTKKSIYKKEKNKILVFDPEKNDYVEQSKPEFPILGKFSKDLKENMDIIFNADDKAGLFLWETLRNNFYYSALNVPKAASDYRDIDRALVWGFNWKKGPFQLWDLMG